jgi:hypothetical protein
MMIDSDLFDFSSAMVHSLYSFELETIYLQKVFQEIFIKILRTPQ